MFKNCFVCIEAGIFVEFKVVFSFDVDELNCYYLSDIVVSKKSNYKSNELIGIIEYVRNNFVKKLCITCILVCDVIAEK